MPDGGYSFLMIKGVPMVTASVKIDVTTVGELHAMLTEWATRRQTTPVVDVSGACPRPEA